MDTQLKLNEDGRFELDGVELICGDIIWIDVAGIQMSVEIEKDGKTYYGKPVIVQLESGMRAQR